MEDLLYAALDGKSLAINMNKLEASFISKKLKPYIKQFLDPNISIECKYVRGKNYCFRSDKSFEKELRNMLITQNKGMLYKFSDIAAIGTPYDMIYVKCPGYFFIYWESSGITYQISVDAMKFIYESQDKSLSEERAIYLSNNIIRI